MPINQADIAEHRNLEAQLSATAYAPPTLAQVRAQAQRVFAGIAADQAGLDALKLRTEREHKDWRDIETRTLKRLWQKRRQTAAMQALYSRAFDGPTPQFPQEDAAEAAYTAAGGEYEIAQGARWAEGEALRLLKEADQLLGSAIKATRGAGDFATINSYGGPANFDILERSELAGAQRDADQARLLVQQAGQVLPGMPGIQAVELPKGNMVADVFFDTTWSELAFQGRIDAADTQLQNARKSLGVIIEQVQRQVGSSSPAAQAALQRLEQARAALFEVRRSIMNNL
ncbi:hypothetical protein CspHIS471_0310840 [Cutaneotrichosporon sp. HIS471]|nr:hypothetical protein CspHIS471_0310840 [Cutaneotrichosporon sp. HIS471]